MKYISSTILGLAWLSSIILTGSVVYNLIKPLPPDHFNEKAINILPNETNPALVMNCKSIGYGIMRCKNWEVVCIVFPNNGNHCIVLNAPKQLHWRK